MRLPLPTSYILMLALACAAGASAQEGTVTDRCPNNDYKNTISAKEAEKLGCKKLEGAPVTVIQTTKPRPPGRHGRPGGSQRRRGEGRPGGADRRATAMPGESWRPSSGPRKSAWRR